MGTVTAMHDEALADLIADLTQRGLTVATAESLILGLANGDLEWREQV